MGNLYDDILSAVSAPIYILLSPGQRTFVFYLLVAVVIAFVIVRKRLKAETGSASWSQIWKRCFPKEVLWHDSSRRDYIYTALNAILKALIIIPLLGVVSMQVAAFVGQQLAPLGMENSLGSVSILGTIVFGIIGLLITDFLIFYIHYLMHVVPWLWSFHKVHHSCEVLNPFSLHRTHIVETIFMNSVIGVIIGALIGTINYFWLTDSTGAIAVTALGFVIFNICGYNLRHSHVWVSYGPKWSKIFVSPAMHQIHHSSLEKHWDKNMGLIFSIWDGWFKTLYVAGRKEEFPLGLSKAVEQKRYNTLKGLFLEPFFDFINCFKKFSMATKDVAAIGFIACFCVFSIGTNILHAEAGKKPGSLYLEELTWIEVEEALNAGYKHIIIPTGGTEQNGKHMVLGKHNYIIDHTAGEIAKKVGHTLVAPVAPYTPEGNISPPSGHMNFKGTISLPDKVFASVLEYTARSLKQHGFKVIYFLGDSGDSQAVQTQVAEKLSKLWQTEGVKVVNLDAYYYDNKQTEWLQKQGYSKSQIGIHAGIRDTSELISINKKGINSQRVVGRLDSLIKGGSSGDPLLANAELGKQMLALKIEAAVKQINELNK